jgi:hypothetical protein
MKKAGPIQTAVADFLGAHSAVIVEAITATTVTHAAAWGDEEATGGLTEALAIATMITATMTLRVMYKVWCRKSSAVVDTD